MRTKRRQEAEWQLDREIGARLRSLRLAAGISQVDLALRLGVTFQQIQNYEKARNRLTAGKLIFLSSILEVPVEQLLMASPSDQRPQPAPMPSLLAPEPQDASRALHREALKLVRHFALIENPRSRKHILTLVKHLAGAAAEQPEAYQDAA